MTQTPDERWVKCRDCPLAGRTLVKGDGPSSCSLMIVGTAPSRSEEAVGKPFSGKTSGVVREVIEGMGLTDQTFFTNLIPRCPRGTGGANRKPSAREIDACSCHLLRDIERTKPDLIVAVGATPLRFLVGRRVPSLKLVHGLTMHANRFDMRLSIMGVFDPAYLARRGGLLSVEGQAWVADLQSVRESLEKGIG